MDWWVNTILAPTHPLIAILDTFPQDSNSEFCKQNCCSCNVSYDKDFGHKITTTLWGEGGLASYFESTPRDTCLGECHKFKDLPCFLTGISSLFTPQHALASHTWTLFTVQTTEGQTDSSTFKGCSTKDRLAQLRSLLVNLNHTGSVNVKRTFQTTPTN